MRVGIVDVGPRDGLQNEDRTLTPQVRAELCEKLAAAGVPTGKVFTAEDMLEDPHYAARENVVTVEDPEIGALPMQNVVPRLSETPGEVRWTGPTLGQHNDEVYGGLLKLGEEQREGLRERGIL